MLFFLRKKKGKKKKKKHEKEKEKVFNLMMKPQQDISETTLHFP